MSEEYEKWNQSPYGRSNYAPYDQENVKVGWDACEEIMQRKLDEKAQELAMFREFAEAVRIKDAGPNWPISDIYPNNLLKHFGLIDADGNPTPLLKGD